MSGVPSKKSPHCIGHGNAIFRIPFEKIHRSFTLPRLRCLFASLEKVPLMCQAARMHFLDPFSQMFTKYLLLTRQRLPQKVLLFNPTENRILNSLFLRNFLETQNDHFQTLAVVIQKTGSEDFLPCCRYQFYIHFFALMESLKPSFTLLSICSGRSCCHQILRSKSLRFIVPAVLPIRFLRTEREPYSAVPR